MTSFFKNKLFLKNKRNLHSLFSGIECILIINWEDKFMSIKIVGEIGINHNGDLDIAKKLIDGAKEAGADAVKFQKRDINTVYNSKILDSPRK